MQVINNGKAEPIDPSKISQAIAQTFKDNHDSDLNCVSLLTLRVISAAQSRYGLSPTMEQLQDATEEVLMQSGFYDIAKKYIIARYERQKGNK